MRNLAILVALTLAILACGEADLTGDGPGVPEPVEAPWQLESGAHEGAQIPIVGSHPITMTLEGGAVGGTAGCNGYGGAYEFSGREFSIADGLSVTDVACHPEEVMESEQRFLEALLAVEEAELSDETLILTGPDTELVFTELEPAPIAELVGTDWVLESLIEGDAVVSVGGERATLVLRPDGTLAGSTGCRLIAGEYTVSGSEVLFTSWGAEGECPGELADQDGVVVTVLGDGFRAEVDGDTLTLWSRGNQGLIYRASA